MFQIADRPPAQARRLGQFLLRQPGLGAQLDRVDIGDGGDEPLPGEGGRHSVEQRGDRARGIIAADFDRPLPAWVLTVAATALGVYGLWATIQHSEA